MFWPCPAPIWTSLGCTLRALGLRFRALRPPQGLDILGCTLLWAAVFGGRDIVRCRARGSGPCMQGAGATTFTAARGDPRQSKKQPGPCRHNASSPHWPGGRFALGFRAESEGGMLAGVCQSLNVPQFPWFHLPPSPLAGWLHGDQKGGVEPETPESPSTQKGRVAAALSRTHACAQDAAGSVFCQFEG